MIKFDKEYSTQWVDEYKYLKNHGVYPSFVKYANDNSPITTYKYTKTSDLFYHLQKFYSMVYHK